MEEQDIEPEEEVLRRGELHRDIKKSETCNKINIGNNQTKNMRSRKRTRNIRERISKIHRVIWRPGNKFQKILGGNRCALHLDGTSQSHSN